jgi:hypothetical protein
MSNLPENVAVIKLVYFTVSRICYTWMQRLCSQEKDVGQQPWVTRVCKLTRTCTSVTRRTGNSVMLWKRELSPKHHFSAEEEANSDVHAVMYLSQNVTVSLNGEHCTWRHYLAFYLILLIRIILWCTSLILTNFLYKPIFYNRTEIKQ